MKHTLLAALAASLVASSLWAQAPAPQAPGALPAPMPANMKTLKDQASYAIGLNIGNNFKTQGVDLNFDLLGQGIRDAVTGAKPALTEKQIDEIMTNFTQQIQPEPEFAA